MLDAITVITRSHLPLARVLAASLLEHQPDARLTVVVSDALAAEIPQQPFAVLDPLALGLDEREWHRRAAIYDAQGLISSLRPLALMMLLAAGAPSALLLDADMLVLAPIADLWTRAAADGILLSPHATAPAEGRAGAWVEEQFLLAGTFNGGLLGVGSGAQAFLEWLAARARRDCLFDRERGLLYTQTWLNLVPALFDHAVLRDAGVNTTRHALGGHDLGGEATSPTVHGRPVRLFHFTGIGGGMPATVAAHPVLAALWTSYEQRLHAEGWSRQGGGGAYRWAHLASGEPITPEIRRRYREALLGVEHDLAPEPPDPFDPADPSAFDRWWAHVLTHGATDGVRVVLLGTGLYAEELIDLAAAIPGIDVVACCENLDRTRVGTTVRGVPVVWIDELPQLGDVVAVSAITTTERERYVGQVAALGVPFGRLVHPSAVLAPSVVLGDGVVIQAGVVIGAQTVLEDHVMVNRGALVGHHSRLEAFVTVQPGANIGGATRIGRRAYVALGAHVLDRCTVGEGSVVGAAALVTKDVDAHVQVVGLPARVVKHGVSGR